MSQPPVSYGQQYVSGVVAVFTNEFPAQGWAYAVNRGAVAETVKAQFYQPFSTEPLFDEELVVEPGGMARLVAVLPYQELILSPDSFYAQIWTTSLNLVPSCVFYSFPEGSEPVVLGYFAPGDLAQFILPFDHPVPGPPIPPPVTAP